MAFPVGWTRKCALVVQHGQVPADQTAFPVLVTEASLPAEMVTAGGANAAQSDGGDIRFSSDSAGASQLACEIVAWTQNASPASAKAEIWVPVSVLTGSDVTIYVWYSAGGGVTQPAASAAFGSQAVWDSNHRGVWHLPNGSSLTANDSTANGNNSSGISATATAGKIDGGANFSTAQPITVPTSSSLNFTGAYTLEAWVYPTISNLYQAIIARTSASGVRQYAMYLSASGTGSIFVGASGGSGASYTVTSPWATNAWNHVVVSANGSTKTIYINGAAVNTSAGDASAAAASASTYFGYDAPATNYSLSGKLDELRISSIARSATWIATEYNNQNAPGSFVVAGTPAGVSGATVWVLAGAITGAATESGALAVRRALAGAAGATSSGSGALRALRALGGKAAAASSGVAALAVKRVLAGIARGVAVGRGSFGAVLWVLAGTAAGAGVVAATLTARRVLGGLARGASAGAGALRLKGGLFGTTAGAGQTAAALSAARVLSGIAAGLGRIVGTLAGVNRVNRGKATISDRALYSATVSDQAAGRATSGDSL